MTGRFFRDPRTLERLHRGPLGPYIDGFAELLCERGYRRGTGRGHLALVATLSRWLERRQLGATDLDPERIEEFLKARRPRVRRRSRAILDALVQQLRDEGVISPPAVKPGDKLLEQLESDFARYLTRERGLSSLTLILLPADRETVLGRDLPGDCDPAEHHSGAGSDRVRSASRPGIQPWTRQADGDALRAFFRFLRQRGDIATDLAVCVPTVPDWRLTSAPRSLEPEQVQRLAIQMLRRGATLFEIGKILRHRRPDTTLCRARPGVRRPSAARIKE